ncbi:hypothetical protein FGG08_000730 [Glutinoglossum americanum]|uniref:AhpC/TSA antioxidant enzyme-domain-containing protein n=1 Tax=Glutinoglossum americanum TaxID=1670608 RepID=A0A9P8ICR1_9PEZI|nr:hypothetical protein FGG08_000730 [Glutinoglossum americanum]
MAKAAEEPSRPVNSSTTMQSCEFDPSANFQGDLAVSDDIPTQDILDAAADLMVLGADGASRPFKSLYTGEGVASRVLIVFVRHFFCGNCQEYLRTLASSITPDSLRSLSVPTSIAVVGCGHPDLIPMYTDATLCPFPVYADPSRKLYDKLGMSRTLSLGNKKPDYMRTSILSGVLRSMVQGVRSGAGATKGGDIKQVGGEFMFDEGKVVWCHRMKNTRDHSEIPELRGVLGLNSEPDEKPANGISTA